MTPVQRRRHDLAYACFLFPFAISAVVAIGSVVPVDDATVAGLGFMVLMPLALIALIRVPIGIYFSFVLWRDGVLPALSILTIPLVVEVMTDAGSVSFYNATTGPIYASLAVVLEASWFLWRRWRAVPSPNNRR